MCPPLTFHDNCARKRHGMEMLSALYWPSVNSGFSSQIANNDELWSLCVGRLNSPGKPREIADQTNFREKSWNFISVRGKSNFENIQPVLFLFIYWHLTVLKHLNTITVTSQWARWRPKSPWFRLFTQPFVQAQTKENIKAPRHWPLWREFAVGRLIPRTKGQ